MRLSLLAMTATCWLTLPVSFAAPLHPPRLPSGPTAQVAANEEICREFTDDGGVMSCLQVLR